MRLAAEARVEVAEHLTHLFLAVDVEDDVAGQHGKKLHTLFGAFQFALIAHFISDVDDGNVEPRRPVVVHHVAAAIVHPHLTPVGTVQTVRNRIGVALLDLGGDLVGNPFAVDGMHHADERVARDSAELAIGGTAEQCQHIAAHVVDKAAVIVGAVAEQATGNAVEELLGHLIGNLAALVGSQLAFGNAMKHRHATPPPRPAGRHRPA